ncbi:MAG: clostripain-related cysteine peptidase [Candidatus Eremiobacteraeota bacterium]|nr:clostripain-related cysteine peptidase [Candidatus Eremiobacteraeota bacterium]
MNIDRISAPQNQGIPQPPEKPPQQESTAPPPQDQVSLGKGPEAPPKKELTMLFYMHGQYKDLHKTTTSAFFPIEQAGSNENVNVVAQLGRAPQEGEPHHLDGDWSGVRRYYVTKHPHDDINMTLPQWLEVKEKIPDNPVVHYVLGDIYAGMGDKQQAKAEYDKAKELGMLAYMEKNDSPESKKIREELDAATKPYEDAYQDKQVFGSAPLETLAEATKMGDPQTLKDFISWGMKNYPAEHYVVVVTGHGGAWIGALEMNPAAMNKAIQEGTAEASKAMGAEQKVDALLFNSCYMGNLEAAYEMKGAADINIASENYSRGNMLHDWDDHITRVQDEIKSKGQFDAREFARDFVEYYRSEGKEVKENTPEFIRWKESYLTLTAIDNKKLDNVVGAWKGFVDACRKSKVPDHVLFSELAKSQGFNSSAFNPAQTIFAFYDMIKDIGDSMRLIGKNPAIPQTVKEEAAKVSQAVKDAVIAEQHEGKDMDNATGLTIWAPSNAVDIAYMADRYEKENVPTFAADTGYLAMLKDAAKKVDKKVLKSFMADTTLIRNIKTVLADPKSGLSDKEKKTLDEAREKIFAHAMKLKDQLDLTTPRIQPLWLNLLKGDIDYSLYGKIGRELADEAVQKGTMKD